MKYTVNVQQDVVVPEPQYAKAVTSQDRVAAHVSSTFIVLTTINFDDQAQFEAREIDDVSIDHYLPSETGAQQLPLAQRLPKLALGIGHVGAKLPRVTFQ